jgi:hypothetical protein
MQPEADVDRLGLIALIEGSNSMVWTNAHSPSVSNPGLCGCTMRWT